MGTKANYETMNYAARRERMDKSRRAGQLNRIYRRDGGICQLCHRPCSRADASRDHIKDFALCTPEEAKDDDNMVLAHKECNNNKHHKPGHSVDVRDRNSHLSFTIQEAFPDFKWNITDLPSESD